MTQFVLGILLAVKCLHVKVLNDRAHYRFLYMTSVHTVLFYHNDSIKPREACLSEMILRMGTYLTGGVDFILQALRSTTR